MTAAEIADRLRARRAGSGKWKACCPAHDDQKPSLSIRDGRDGKILFKCHAGCTIEAILIALGLTVADISGVSGRIDSKQRATDTIYDYRDTANKLVFQVVRYANPKTFRQRRPDGQGGWIWNMEGIARVLFNLPALIEADVILIAEGERDAQSLQRAASSFPDQNASVIYAATCNVGGAGKWLDEYSRDFRGKKVVVFQDNDAVGREHALQVCSSVSNHATSVRLVELPGLAEKGDVSDYLESHSPVELFAQMQATPFWNSPAVVAAPVTSDGPGMSAESVATLTAGLLEKCCSWIRRYIVLSEEQAIILSAWLLHTWAFDAASTTPYVHIWSAEKASGKTTLLHALKCLARAPKFSTGISAAALGRVVAESRPTLFLDELDAQMRGDRERAQDIRGVLNGGFELDGTYTRCVGKDSKVVDFPTFCPKALAGIGSLWDTVASRSISIELLRKKKSEKAEPFRRRRVDRDKMLLRDALEAWATGSTVEALAAIEPADIEGLSDRQMDLAEPLLQIGELAGPQWVQSISAALRHLFKAGDAEDSSVGVQLLHAIRPIFDERQAETVPSKLLVEDLCEIEGGLWADWDHGKGMTANHVARQLKRYGIKPGTIRFPSGTAKGYRRSDFEDAWSRYCPSPPATTVTPSQPPSSLAEAAFSMRNTKPDVTVAKTTTDPREQRSVTAVTAASVGCGHRAVVTASHTDLRAEAEGKDEVRI